MNDLGSDKKTEKKGEALLEALHYYDVISEHLYNVIPRFSNDMHDSISEIIESKKNLKELYEKIDELILRTYAIHNNFNNFYDSVREHDGKPVMEEEKSKRKKKYPYDQSPLKFREMLEKSGSKIVTKIDLDNNLKQK